MILRYQIRIRCHKPCLFHFTMYSPYYSRFRQSFPSLSGWYWRTPTGLQEWSSQGRVLVVDRGLRYPVSSLSKGLGLSEVRWGRSELGRIRDKMDYKRLTKSFLGTVTFLLSERQFWSNQSVDIVVYTFPSRLLPLYGNPYVLVIP